MSLDTHRLSLFSQVVLRFYEIAQSAPMQRFQEEALNTLRLVLPFDSGMWGSATMTEHGIEIHTLHLQNTSMQMIEDYQKIKHLDHFAHEVTQAERCTIRFDAIDGETLKFRNFLYQYRHLHGLITSHINPWNRFAQWLSLFRQDTDHRCSEEEVHLLDALFPHLMQALAINRKLHMQQLVGDQNHEQWSVAIADHHGFLYHADPEFLTLISENYHLAQNDRLPDEVVHAFAQSITELVGTTSVLRGSQEKDLLFLKIRQKIRADDLSPREFTIAKMMAGGLSLKEIAEKLNRSPDTIRTHSRLIYKKLAVNKATQLSTLLMQRD